MDRIKPRKGFTLIELIVVIAILAILAAIAVPSFIGLIQHSQEAVCIANRETLRRQIYAQESLLDKKLTDSEIEDMKEQSKICPNDGIISISDPDPEHIVPRSISCKIHQEQSTATDAAGKVIQNFGTLDPSDYGYNNDKLFKKYFNTFGWEKIQVGDKTYYARPYYNEKTNEMLVFANENSDGKPGWVANLIYNEKDGKWYRYINKFGNTNASISVANHTWETLNQQVESEINETTGVRSKLEVVETS